MSRQKLDEIGEALRSLTESYGATLLLMERTYLMLCQEVAIDPDVYWRQHAGRPSLRESNNLQTDRRTFTVHYSGRTCFLGNTLAFDLLAYLAKHPNIYISRERLLDEVWKASRSTSAIKSVVSILREKLCKAGMDGLARAIDGSVRGHYALRATVN